jgi:hypothetical protein
MCALAAAMDGRGAGVRGGQGPLQQRVQPPPCLESLARTNKLDPTSRPVPTSRVSAREPKDRGLHTTVSREPYVECPSLYDGRLVVARTHGVTIATTVTRIRI